MAAHEPADVLIIGAGATGSIAAWCWARPASRSSASSRAAGSSRREHPHLQPRLAVAAAHAAGTRTPTSATRPDDYPGHRQFLADLMWNGVGGSTNVYRALWPRYRPSDFRKGTEHGLAARTGRSPTRTSRRSMRRPTGWSASRAWPAIPRCRRAALSDPAAAVESVEAGWPRPSTARLALVAGDSRRQSARTMGRPGLQRLRQLHRLSARLDEQYSMSVWPKALAAGARAAH